MKKMKKFLLIALFLAFFGGLSWPSKKSTSQTTDVTLIGACDIADGFGLNLSGAFATAALLDADRKSVV